MSTKFNSAQNEQGQNAEELRKKEAPADAVPSDTEDSELNIQELLKKYLPDYAEEKTEPVQEEIPAATVVPEEAPAAAEEFAVAYEEPAAAPEEPAAPEESAAWEEVPAEAASVEEWNEIFEETPKQEKKSGGLFARLRKQVEEAEEEEPAEGPDTAVTPDLGIFEEISEEMEEQGGESAAAPVFGELPLAEDGAEASQDPVNAAIDETDINLMVAFGLEEQLEQKMGAGAAEEATARIDAEHKEKTEQYRRAMEYEYTDRSQTPQVADAYKFALGALKIKMAAAALLTVLLFFYENITIFGVQFAGALDPAVYPVVYIMVSLQMTLLVCAMAYEQIFAGFRNLFTMRPTPESVVSVLTVFSVIYSAVIACTVQPGVEPVLFNFPVAVTALMSLVFTYFNTKREVFSFNIVSSKRPKYVFKRLAPAENAAESQAFGATDEDSPDVLRITRTEFVDGYFDRTSTILNSTRVYVGALLSAIAAAAVLMGVFARIGGSTGQEAVTVSYLALVAGVPLSLFFTYSYPFYKANREAYEYDSTIIGEKSLEEYAGAAIVSFEDKDVFPSYGVKVQNIKIYNNNRIDRVLYYAASAFGAAGGPLSDVFDLATMEMECSQQVEVLSAGVGYLETSVDGRQILFGRSDVLTELGFEIPLDVVEEDSYVQGDLSILYMLRDGNLIAKMYVRYVMEADFEFILKQFAKGGTCVCVKTFDPNIDEEMIFSKVRGRKYPLKVVRNTEGCETMARADSGIVTRGTTKSLLQVVSYCDMVLSVKNTNTIISIVSAIVSLAIVFIVTISKNIGALDSWMVVVNHLFWMIPAVLTTKLFIK